MGDLYMKVESGAGGLDGCAFQRENFGAVTQKSTPISKNFLSDSIKVPDLSLSDRA